MQFDQLPRDGQPQPQPAVAAGGGGVGLPEAVEHVGRKSGAMPSPLSVTLTSTVRIDAAPDSDLNPAAVRRELDGVGQQVPEHLLQPVRVARDRRRPSGSSTA